ncbi:DUF6461 domain-containing protein [Nocardioides thalensis]|uniref:DUF6461 domain-containing protein n=1 Tax=Nocardioides thalensis TaxID=1914755 RepID=UPI0031B6062C
MCTRRQSACSREIGVSALATQEDYGWVHDVLFEAACVTAVAGGTRDGVLAAFGADGSVEVPVEDAFADEADYVSVAEVPGGAIAVEHNGFRGSLPEVLVRVAGGGVTASMFWNVNDLTAFSCVRDGVVVATVDMYDADQADNVDLPDELRELFASADRDDADLHATGMAMVETFTGVKVPADVVESMTTAHPIG